MRYIFNWLQYRKTAVKVQIYTGFCGFLGKQQKAQAKWVKLETSSSVWSENARKVKVNAKRIKLPLSIYHQSSPKQIVPWIQILQSFSLSSLTSLFQWSLPTELTPSHFRRMEWNTHTNTHTAHTHNTTTQQTMMKNQFIIHGNMK